MAHLGKALSHFQVILIVRGHLFVEPHVLKILWRYKDHRLWLWLLFSIWNQGKEAFNKSESVVKAVTQVVLGEAAGLVQLWHLVCYVRSPCSAPWWNQKWQCLASSSPSAQGQWEQPLQQVVWVSVGEQRVKNTQRLFDLRAAVPRCFREWIRL